ncbi:XdhC family protein [Alicyclobacillus sp. ALC3]|uniref:XdhC family protein n=1 Tax=Alicyclobacillus sp. ALC3 TaxID=2796143 RepID=UPI0023798F1B|nr:XdhC/CoxI family protein [Alicyclobacillus sp. ALC3]WDL97145.1 XdhC family protein [Alicyclobacillus sp. ALC3]
MNILSALQECRKEGNKAALATVLSVDGSTYQREGARCLVLEDGQIVGVVSGGCVEADLALHAQSVLETGEAKQVSYDFRNEADEVWGLGVGCNGALTLLIQCFDPVADRTGAEELIVEFTRKMETLETYAVATVVTSAHTERFRPGQILYPAPDETMANAPGLSELNYKGVVIQVFVEVVTPRPQLYVFGAGPDAAPLVKIGTFLEWRVRVIDHRPTLLAEHRFPEAEVIGVRRPEYTSIPVFAGAMAVVMTHNYEIDRQLVSHLLKSEASYVGVLGPRKRTDKILTELADQGERFSPTDMKRLYAPVGLNLGAESPEEIALAIVAEAQAHTSQRDALPLRRASGPLHSRSSAPFTVAPDGISPGVCNP